MTVKKDASGRRSVELAVELPGTPEEIWRAIATGPGISSWFVPTDVDEREGGAVDMRFGPGMDSSATITTWKPAIRLAYEERDWAPNAPPLGTEFIIEARSGGKCVLRLVHSLFASGNDWDDQLGGFESGWTVFFGILQLALTYYLGRTCSNKLVLVETSEPEVKVWKWLTTKLGLAGASNGERRTAPDGVPPFAGVVERVIDGQPQHEVLLRTDAPVPGIVSFGAFTWGNKAHVAIRLYYYGDGTADAAARSEDLWKAWMKEMLPPGGDNKNDK